MEYIQQKKNRKLRYFLKCKRCNLNKVRAILTHPLIFFIILVDSVRELIKYSKHFYIK